MTACPICDGSGVCPAHGVGCSCDRCNGTGWMADAARDFEAVMGFPVEGLPEFMRRQTVIATGERQ